MNPAQRGWGMPPVGGSLLVRIPCAGTLPMRVRREVAPLFTELIVRMERVTRPGFMTSSGGYNYRAKRGMEKRFQATKNPALLSEHSWGLAADFRAGENPGYSNRKTDFPRDTAKIAGSVGLSWGGEWETPFDPMHFYFDGTPQEAALWVARVRTISVLSVERKTGMSEEQLNVISQKLDRILEELFKQLKNRTGDSKAKGTDTILGYAANADGYGYRMEHLWTDPVKSKVPGSEGMEPRIELIRNIDAHTYMLLKEFRAWSGRGGL